MKPIIKTWLFICIAGQACHAQTFANANNGVYGKNEAVIPGFPSSFKPWASAGIPAPLFTGFRNAEVAFAPDHAKVRASAWCGVWANKIEAGSQNGNDLIAINWGNAIHQNRSTGDFPVTVANPNIQRFASYQYDLECNINPLILTHQSKIELHYAHNSVQQGGVHVSFDANTDIWSMRTFTVGAGWGPPVALGGSVNVQSPPVLAFLLANGDQVGVYTDTSVQAIANPNPGNNANNSGVKGRIQIF